MFQKKCAKYMTSFPAAPCSYVLIPGAFRGETACPGKQAYSLLQGTNQSWEFGSPDLLFFVRTAKLAATLMEGFDIYAKVVLPENSSVFPSSEIAALAGWPTNTCFIEDRQIKSGIESYLISTKRERQIWDYEKLQETYSDMCSCPSVHNGDILAHYYAVERDTLQFEDLPKQALVSVICDDVHAVWTILLDKKIPVPYVFSKLKKFSKELHWELSIDKRIDI